MSNFIHFVLAYIGASLIFVLAYIGASLIFVIACGRSTMTDLIKREDAIKAVDETPFIRRPILPHYLKAKINQIPSAEKQGKWIDMPRKMFKCSECGQIYQVLEPKNFCPNCGAKMLDKDIDVPVKEHDGLMEDK